MAFQTEISARDCKGCGLCQTVCPQKLIALDQTVINEKGYCTAQVMDMPSCIGCGMCVVMCPDSAIQIYKI